LKHTDCVNKDNCNIYQDFLNICDGECSDYSKGKTSGEKNMEGKYTIPKEFHDRKGENPNPILAKDIERAIEILSEIHTKAKERDASYAIILTIKEMGAMTNALKTALCMYELSWNYTKEQRDEVKGLIKNFGEIRI